MMAVSIQTENVWPSDGNPECASTPPVPSWRKKAAGASGLPDVDLTLGDELPPRSGDENKNPTSSASTV